MSFTKGRDAALERGRLCVVIGTIAINVIAVSLLTFAPWSDWRTGAALNVVDSFLLVGFIIVRRDALLTPNDYKSNEQKIINNVKSSTRTPVRPRRESQQRNRDHVDGNRPDHDAQT